jgi:hypothetical protein
MTDQERMTRLLHRLLSGRGFPCSLARGVHGVVLTHPLTREGEVHAFVAGLGLDLRCETHGCADDGHGLDAATFLVAA